MDIWLITVGEPLPTDSPNIRLMRTGLLAEQLWKNKHKVTWWSSSFDHFNRLNRCKKNTILPYHEDSKILLLYGQEYKKNVSFSRLRNHYQIGKEFGRWARWEKAPDIILCSMPTIELSLKAVRFGKEKNIPVVLDIRDLWPDVFVNLAPKKLRPIAQVLLKPYFQMLKEACHDATAIFGITENIVEWGIQYAGRERFIAFDRAFPLAYTSRPPSEQEIRNGYSFWEKHGISRDNNLHVFSFVGSMGRQINLDIVIEAIREVVRQRPEVRFVFCGNGQRLDEFKQAFSCNDRVLFTGRIGFPEIWTLMRLSVAGLIPYRDTPDFCISIPNKVVEYLSAGLPVLSSLPGTTAQLLSERGCGVTFSSPEEFKLGCQFLCNPENRLLMSATARKTYEELFVAEQVYSNMIKVLEDIALRKGRKCIE